MFKTVPVDREATICQMFFVNDCFFPDREVTCSVTQGWMYERKKGILGLGYSNFIVAVRMTENKWHSLCKKNQAEKRMIMLLLFSEESWNELKHHNTLSLTKFLESRWQRNSEAVDCIEWYGLGKGRPAWVSVRGNARRFETLSTRHPQTRVALIMTSTPFFETSITADDDMVL